MLQNYFVLNRFIVEAKPLLADSKIEEIFSQEKSKLVIVASKNDEVYYLELCVIPGNSYLNIKRNYSRAKKNTVKERGDQEREEAPEIGDDRGGQVDQRTPGELHPDSLRVPGYLVFWHETNVQENPPLATACGAVPPPRRPGGPPA